MWLLESLLPRIASLLPLLVTLAVVALGLWLVDGLVRRTALYAGSGGRFTRQVVILLGITVGVVAVVIALPVADETRGQLLGLLGLVLTAIIALASTTFVSNAMAGFMLRSVGNFRIGDFVRIAEHFGRVTERGLFHTEIQTEDRDLMTLPNLYLVSNPMTVVRSSGTILSCAVSLSYDNPHRRVEALLLEAGAAAALEDCFVQILEIGDFSVGYRVAGFLADVGHLLTARSRLRAAVLDTLHHAGVEILSPDWMAQRPAAPERPVIPPRESATGEPETERTLEHLVFDKAAEAATLERLRGERVALADEIESLEARLADTEADSDERTRLRRELALKRARLAAVEADLEAEFSSDSG